MNCPRCSQPTDEGAAFCGNCGQALPAPFAPPSHQSVQPPVQDSVSATTETVAEKLETADEADNADKQPETEIPAYAVAKPAEQDRESKLVTGLILAVLAIPAGLFIPGLGFILGAVGLVMATMSRNTPKKLASNLAIGFSSLAIVVSVGAFIYYANHQLNSADADKTASQTAEDELPNLKQATPDGTGAQFVDTPCYSAVMPKLVMLDMAEGSCTFKTYNAATANAATTIYTVDAATNKNLTAANFTDTIKPVAGQTIGLVAPGFKVVAEKAGTFADSPAYIVDAKNDKGDTIQLLMVLHQTAHNENVFALVGGASNNKVVDLSELALQWVWK